MLQTHMQVLYNVLSHAVERCNAAHMDPPPKVSVEAHVMRDESHVCVRIQDNVPMKPRERVRSKACPKACTRAVSMLQDA